MFLHLSCENQSMVHLIFTHGAWKINVSVKARFIWANALVLIASASNEGSDEPVHTQSHISYLLAYKTYVGRVRHRQNY